MSKPTMAHISLYRRELMSRISLRVIPLLVRHSCTLSNLFLSIPSSLTILWWSSPDPWKGETNTCQQRGIHWNQNSRPVWSWQANMMLLTVVLIHIFSYLEIEDLVRASGICYQASGICYDWWKLIARWRHLKEAEVYELDLSEMEDLYCFLPLTMFATLTRLNISSTKISNRHLLQIMHTAANLEYLDISYCTSLEQTSIFEIKHAVFSHGLEYMDISGNQERWHVSVCVKTFKLSWSMDTTFMEKNCCSYWELLNPLQAVHYSSKQKTDTIR